MRARVYLTSIYTLCVHASTSGMFFFVRFVCVVVFWFCVLLDGWLLFLFEWPPDLSWNGLDCSSRLFHFDLIRTCTDSPPPPVVKAPPLNLADPFNNAHLLHNPFETGRPGKNQQVVSWTFSNARGSSPTCDGKLQ